MLRTTTWRGESVPRLTLWCSTGRRSPVMLMAGLEHVSTVVLDAGHSVRVSRRLPVAPGPGPEVGAFAARARVATRVVAVVTVISYVTAVGFG